MRPLHPSYSRLARKKLIIALLAHQDEAALAAQIANIRYFVPEAGIILYNGGSNRDFAKQLRVFQFPHSRPLRYGHLTPYLWEIMQWLEEIEAGYEYLMNVDHDVLFFKRGFQAFLDQIMEQSDCMGWRLHTSKDNPDSLPIRNMFKEWHLWQPVFGLDSFISYFNPGQIYKRGIVQRMLAHADVKVVDSLLDRSEAFALEEVFFATMAKACGGRVREYPEGSLYNDLVHWGGDVTFASVLQHKNSPHYYWVHPVKGAALIELDGKLRAMDDSAAEPLREEVHETAAPAEAAPAEPPASPAIVIDPVPVELLPPPSASPPIRFRRKRRLRRVIRLRKGALKKRRKPLRIGRRKKKLRRTTKRLKTAVRQQNRRKR
ncbi:hypothetical protein [Paenibacillus aestuarii]|uniref:Glycosyl transferase n=1 Tax=Paenibacillus aestuarii TaxID=516965 RepID=A0ABW0K281_9BACL|nr:hypothetical protein [Paenibacillus aestuarii]